MALQCSLLINCSTKCLTENIHSPFPYYPSKKLFFLLNPSTIKLPSPQPSTFKPLTHQRSPASTQKPRASKQSNDSTNNSQKSKQSISDDDDDDDDGPTLMTEPERAEMRRKIHEMLDSNPDVEEETDPLERKMKMEKLLAEYPLVVEEEDADWPEDADGWGFNFDQFFNKITIKNVKKDDSNEDDDNDVDEVVWQDDDYIRPMRDITAAEWEDTVFTDFNPLVILVHNRYKRPQANEKARIELEKAVHMFWQTGLPSPRCVAVDAVVEDDIVSALRVSAFPEILFTKAGKILHRDRVVRSADEWSKMMAFFYYKAVRPECLADSPGASQEKIPSLSISED